MNMTNDQHVMNYPDLPIDLHQACLIGRLWNPGSGPTLVTIHAGHVLDLSDLALTCSELLDLPDAERQVRQFLASGKAPILGHIDEILNQAHDPLVKPVGPWLMAPCDLQAIKAAGVTFVSSMLERVIEEQARGDASKAEFVRKAVTSVIGDNLRNVKPGSPESAKLKEVLTSQGMWSQYLEVGIGPDAEIFTKSQPMSAVGTGAQVGLHPDSHWNNPEPEIVLAVNSLGQVVGATLGNDVNLRDFEGRSALLLGKAKDNNASCAIGPFIRLFDSSFTMDDVRQCVLHLEVRGPEGFTVEGASEISQISRDPLDLVCQAMGTHHQYPDGMMLFLGTMFAPIQDRLGPGQGFTHVVGDTVSVFTPQLGRLFNHVTTSDKARPWTYGLGALMRDLARRRA